MKTYNFWQRLRSALRLLWLRSPRRTEIKNAARVSYGQYKCAHCSGVFRPKEVEVDHVVACGSLKSFEDLPVFAQRLFEGEQVVLCKPCHKTRTQEERKSRRER